MIYILLLFGPLAVAAAELAEVRVWAGPDRTRVVLDISADTPHTMFTLDKPDRVVVDLPAVRAGKLAPRAGKGVVSNVRFGRRGDGTRVVLDLARAVDARSFLLQPSGEYGHRLVVDLFAENAAAADAPPERAAQAPQAAQAPPGPQAVRTEARDIVIAIDPGHGGEDPGASGARGTREKDVALQIARRVAALIDERKGMRAVLTRTGDYYVPHRKRIAIAQQASADLFMSIHADAFHDRRARGASVYVLSEKGASSEHARLLAKRENAADLVGGIDLDDKDGDLLNVLVDFLQTAALEASLDVGQRMLSSMAGLGKLHSAQVQRAGFLVLKAPNIPSVLVETAFISNREEERRLRDPQYQRKLAQQLVEAIDGYFRDYRPQRVVADAGASREHVIRNGETLSEIAMAYGTSVGELRQLNGIRGDSIRIGDRLQIP